MREMVLRIATVTVSLIGAGAAMAEVTPALDGTFRGTAAHLIRADLYHGQPCPTTGGAYFFIPVIGYYRCERF